MENRYKRKTDGHGHAYFLLVLLNVLALREAYIGNENWWLVHLITIPLLILYVLAIYKLNKARRGNIK